jgi:PAS domain S-box-containing protein
MSEHVPVIHKRAVLDEERKDIQERFLRICEMLPLAIFETDSNDRCLYVNPRWTEITGQVAEQFTGHGWRDAIAPFDREWVLEEVELARGQNRMFDADFRVQRENGATCWVHGRSLPLHGSDGTHDGFLHAIYNIENRKLIEDQLRGSLEGLKTKACEQSARIQHCVSRLKGLVQEMSEIASGQTPPAEERLRKDFETVNAVFTELLLDAPEEIEDHSLDDVLF